MIELSCMLFGVTVMKDGIRASEQVKVSRQEIYEGYVNCYLQQCTDIQPCRDACLLEKAALYLREPEHVETFTMFPFYQALCDCCEAPTSDCRKLLSSFIKAAELLETVCVNLFLQPWKKEIKTLKTYTGPFVYCLLPVLSSSTIQSVLASIGYLPHTDTSQSEYRLSDDANPDRAMLVGFELMLARVECYHIVELFDKDQVGLKEWLDVLRRRLGPEKLEPPTEKKKTMGQKEDKEKRKEDADNKEVPPYLYTRLAVNPEPKPRRCHLISLDRSIMEMQMTYPDLAFRGRPLLPNKPHLANTSKSNSKVAHTATNNYSGDSKAPMLYRRDCIKDTKAAATLIHNKNDGSKAAEVFGHNDRNKGCNCRNGGQTTTQGDTISTSFSNTDLSRGDNELSHSKGISLRITLRAGSTADQTGEHQSTAEPHALSQQQTTADPQNKRLVNTGLPSLCSMGEEQELRELAERMGQLILKENKDELRGKEDKKRGEEHTNKERRKKERKASTKKGAEESNLRRPVMETGPGLSHVTSRCVRSSQSDTAVMKDQWQPTVCEASMLTFTTIGCQSCKGGNTGQQEREDTESALSGRGEVEQLAQSYVIVEHHKK